MITLDDIRDGLIRNEFFLEYMPVVSLADGRCVGAEALIRWKRPTGIVSPEEFIPIADNTPLSGSITYWVIDTVAAELGDWLGANPEAYVSINVPPEILGRGGLEYAGRKSGLSRFSAQVILEITERSVPDLLGLQAINDNPGSGVRLALDDFSHAGGANLSLLARCNFDIVKLDESLVSQINEQCPAPEWLEGFAALLRTTKLELIAEGVETERQLVALWKAGIQSAQGHHFSPSLPAEALFRYYRHTRGRRYN